MQQLYLDLEGHSLGHLILQALALVTG